MSEVQSPLVGLRQVLKDRGLSGFIVPRADEYQGEFVPPSAKRLGYLTGFTGSAGVAIVLPEVAAVFSDGRYTLQMQDEVDTACFQTRHITDEPATDWIKQFAQKGDLIGYDPWLHTPNGLKVLADAARSVGAQLVACDTNPLDAVWVDRPAAPSGAVVAHPLEYSGHVSLDKRREIASRLERDGHKAAVLSLPDSIAWLLNIRGSDLQSIPVVLSFAIIESTGCVDWFVDPSRVSSDVKMHLSDDVRIVPPSDFLSVIAKISGDGATVRVDPTSIPVAVTSALTRHGATVHFAADPCLQAKAIKNTTELNGFRQAHRRDGAAMVRFLNWFDRHALGCDEAEVAKTLQAYRAEQDLYAGLSFPSIAGTGPNGAIVHYHAREGACRTLEAGQLFLLDSGGQYRDGTTDITRTLPVGEVGAEERRSFTRVLQGHIDLSLTIFPAGTTGSQLDTIARRPSWSDGLDYDHGTGHGVGSFLSVHEGPQSLSKRPSSVALKPGMVLSNEPGYYKAGHYGIRIENLVAVCEVDGGERPMLGFEILTLVPIDRRLIDVDLLSQEQLDWLDDYHARVAEVVGPLVDGEAAVWLAGATAPLA